MLTSSDLVALAEDDGLTDDYAKVLQALAGLRVGHESVLGGEEAERLHGFVEFVLSYAHEVTAAKATGTAFMAANAALALATFATQDARRMRFRAGLLFELADRPMMASAIVDDVGGPKILDEYFKRLGPFASLDGELGQEQSHNGIPADAPLLGALGQQAWDLAEYQRGNATPPTSASATALLDVALNYGLDLNASDVVAFAAATASRAKLSTREHVPEDLLDDLATGGFPPELWTGQALALENGLLDETFNAWSFSAPTGTGKTFLARLLILATLRAHPGRKILYIVPSRALVRQVTVDLSKSLEELGIEVMSVTPQLVALEDSEDDTLRQADVLVLTPEKADLLLRIEAAAMDEVALVVIDEAHHIENGTRGVLLELYLWRLKHLAGDHALTGPRVLVHRV